MNPQYWVGFGFAVGFVGFLMLAFFKAPNLTSGQRLILRIMSSLCAGIAAYLISGEALLNLSRDVPGGKLTISGTAGFALFFVIWLFFPKEPTIPHYPDAYNTTIPEDWTFQDAAEDIVKSYSGTITYEGFTPQELNSKLKAWPLTGKTPSEALQKLRLLTVIPASIRDYDVKQQNSTYILKIK